MRMVSEGQNCTARWVLQCCILAISVLGLVAGASAQDTGSIAGTVSSTKGGPVSAANVVITNKDTGQTSMVTTDAAGKYKSAELAPADYAIHVDAGSFISVTISVTVKAGPATITDIQLVPEPVPGVIPTENFRVLPFNGRNFVQAIELQPGVQVPDAGSIDPTKSGFTALSLRDETGRTTRIAVDRTDITDKMVGAVTQNIPADAVEEVRFGGLLGPVSDQLLLPGTVNFVTRSGGNDLHGDLFGFFRNGNALSASLPGGHSHDWGRQQYGGDLGGAIEQNKLFFFLSAERNRQDLANPVLVSGPFVALSPSATTIREPFREIEATGRLDYIASERTRAFYRFSYDQNADTAPFGSGPSLQPMKTQTNTPSNEAGIDFTHGDYTHALRFEYLKFENVTRDASANVSGLANPVPSVSINIGGGAYTGCTPGSHYCSGPSPWASQQTDQSNLQFRYDGTRTGDNHVFHFGASFNRILIGRYAALYSLAPALSDPASLPLPAGIFGSTGFASDPTSYPVLWAFLGNGQGFATERSAFGFPRGGQKDNQVMLYGGDTWKINPKLTVTYGVHWVRDTGVSDSELAGIQQLNAWGAGLGNKVRQPNFNFAPQLGVAWDTSSSGKTVLRGGIGMFYDDSLFANEFADRPLRLAQGAFVATPAVCIGGMPGAIQWSNPGPVGSLVANGAGVVNSNGLVSPTWCGESVGMAAPQAVALQQAYQAATAAAASGANPTYMGNLHGYAGPYENGLSLLAPNYQTPRTVQMNGGLQHELRPGLIFTLDYERDVTTRSLLGVDVNHGGAADTFNVNNALADRDAAQIANGCSAGPGQVSCMIAKFHSPAGALAEYGAYGIGGPAQVTGGAACPTCAFPGVNPNLGVNVMNFAEGRSVYSGVNVSLRQVITNLSSKQVHRAFFEFSYSHSHDYGQSPDAGVFSQATDYVNPDHFTGPTALDRTHQVSIGAHFDLEKSLSLSFISRFLSPLPATLSFQQTAGGAEVLVTDVTGDGTTGDLIPGTNIGSYMRRIKPGGLQNYITYYNNTFAGAADPATPAGNSLVNGGVFSLQELESLGGVMQPLAQTVPDVAGMGWMKTFDVRLGWEHKFGDRIVVTPNVAAFNLLNFANFDLPGHTQSGILSFGPNSLSPWAAFLQPQNTAGGSTNGGMPSRTNRASLGSGMNGAGAPRSLEFGLKITF